MVRKWFGSSGRQRFSNENGKRRTSSSRRSRPGGTLLPRMESLEDRRLLAVTVGNDGDLINGNVDSIADLIAADGGDGISLREAITAANNTAGVDVIEFAPQVKGTISLTNGQLDVTDELTINGPGRNSLTVSGNQLSRVFNIESTVSINNMTIADGLVLGEGSGFGSSLPGGMGGAVFVSSDGDLSLNRVTATKNQVNGNYPTTDPAAVAPSMSMLVVCST